MGLVQIAPEWVVSPVLTLFSGRHFMHVRRALALTLAVPVLLAGCSDDPEPTPNIPDPTSSSPTPTEPATEEPEAESPEEFIRRWVEANTRMQNSGEVEEYSTLSSKCRPCLQTAKRVEQIYANGGFVKTDGWILGKVIDRSGTTGNPVLDLEIESSPTTFKERADAERQELPGGDIVMRVRLTSSAPWQVVRLTQVPS
jgi:hypothetical protein